MKDMRPFPSIDAVPAAPLSGGAAKVAELAERINSGAATAEETLRDLPPGFANSVREKIVQKPETQTTSPEAPKPPSEESFTTSSSFEFKPLGDNDVMPVQYRGITSPEALDIMWTVPIYVDPEKTKFERDRKQRAMDSLIALQKDEDANIAAAKESVQIDSVRAQLEQIDTPANPASPEKTKTPESTSDQTLEGLVASVTEGRSEAVKKLYEEWMKDSNNPENRKKLARALFQDVYNRYRLADYPVDEKEEETWDAALTNTRVPVDNRKAEWQYRGNFPKGNESTITRGSLNVHVTPELIEGLDNLISSGKVRMNYKFGMPGSSAAPTARHDSISIYFLEEPSQEILEAISNVAAPFVRGDSLLGTKVSDGFYMSEVGNIDSDHVDKLVEDTEKIDAALADAIKGYASPRPGQGTKLKLSEAQYYAVRDVANALGNNFSYTTDSGFEVSKMQPKQANSIPAPSHTASSSSTVPKA